MNFQSKTEEEFPEGKPGFDRKMSREEINALPLDKYKGPVHIIRTPDELPKALKVLNREKVLGFDTETRPAYKKGQRFLPALLQLAAGRAVYLIQLHQISLNDGLGDLLSNPKILKVGVALDYDIARLKEISPFEAAGFLDLSHVAKEHQIKNHGLRGLAAIFLGFRISKQAQRSNWQRKQLLPRQVDYAATDAWVSREIYLRFKKRGLI